jgi:hypothetical protein
MGNTRTVSVPVTSRTSALPPHSTEPTLGQAMSAEQIGADAATTTGNSTRNQRSML